jgi:hypothetical protein
MEEKTLERIDGWTVTFIFRGEYVETPSQKSPGAALGKAIEIKAKE